MSPESQLLQHLTEWVAALTKYGGSVRQDESTLRALFLGLLPKEYEVKLKPKVAKYQNWQSLHQYCKDKLEQFRDQQIADALHGKKSGHTGRRYANALDGTGDQIIAQTGNGRHRPGEPQPATVATGPAAVPTMQDLATMINALGTNARRPPPPGARNQQGGNAARTRKFPRFFFKGCWECGKEGHSRHECEIWKRLLASNNNKPPQGHKGAKDKAYLEWKEKRNAANKAKNGRIASLTEDNTEEEDGWSETGDSDDQIFSFISSDQGPDFAHPNRLQAIEDDDDDEDPEVDAVAPANDFGFLNEVAHRIQLGKRMPQSQRKKKPVTASSDGLDQIRKFMKPLPTDPVKLSQIAKLLLFSKIKQS